MESAYFDTVAEALSKALGLQTKELGSLPATEENILFALKKCLKNGRWVKGISQATPDSRQLVIFTKTLLNTNIL